MSALPVAPPPVAAQTHVTASTVDFSSAYYSVPTPLPDPSTDEQALACMVNCHRATQNACNLQLDKLLCAVARKHSQDMATRNYFDHTSPAPSPTTPMDRYLKAVPTPPDYLLVGENIYYRSSAQPTDCCPALSDDAFMHSPGHRANMLQPRFTKMGVGIYRNAQTGAMWVTEMFLRDQE